jgi:hypothetical protein
MRSPREIHIKVWNAVEQTDGSYLHKDGDVCWYNEAGEYHKEDGPAQLYTYLGHNGVSWHLNGKHYVSFKAWLKASNASEETKMLLRLQYE